MTTPSGILAEVEAFLEKFRNPQTAVVALAALVSAFGSIGILQAPLVGWLQGVLSAALALLSAIATKPATAVLARRAARAVARSRD